MNAEQALSKTKSRKPILEIQEYNRIMKDIERCANNGEKKMWILNDLPSQSVQNRLIVNGYRFVRYTAGFPLPFPDMYAISWENERVKKQHFPKWLFWALLFTIIILVSIFTR